MGRPPPAPASVRRRVAVGAELEDEIGWDAQAARIALAAVAAEPGAVRLLLAEILGVEMAGDAGLALQELLMAVGGVVADRPQADVVVAAGRGGVAGAHARIGGALDEAVARSPSATCARHRLKPVAARSPQVASGGSPLHSERRSMPDGKPPVWALRLLMKSNGFGCASLSLPAKNSWCAA